ncbi:MAG: hypothetical protein WEC79_03920 [Thermomicrobiales bacterium]
MIPSFDPILWRRASWSVLALAGVAFICLGVAEQGSRGGGLQTPPHSPLPFERHRVFGLNLAGMSSLQALDWLNAAGNPSLALVVLPIDAEVVASLGQDDSRDAGLAAIDALRHAAGGSSLAVCLRRPQDTIGGLPVAEAAVSAISARFPEQIVYVGACDPAEHPAWQADVAEAARTDAEIQFPVNALIPLAGGDVVVTQQLDGTDELDSTDLRVSSPIAYSFYLLDSPAPLNDETIQDAAAALADSTQAALVLVAPTDGVDPAGLAGSIASVRLPTRTLPEGFSGVTAPSVNLNDVWQRTNVGTIVYMRATQTGAALAAEFIGTDVYLMGIEGPDSGIVQVWIDPDSPSAPPSVVLDLAAGQARDAAIPIARGLPAARHQLIIQAGAPDGTNVTISGLYVTGTPATAWAGMMAAAVVLLAAVVALAERSYTAVVAIRQRGRPPSRRPRTGHPRVFARDR